MTRREFMNRVAHGKSDFLREFMALLEEAHVPFCAIGGLAVNAYAEPVVSLDLDVVLLAAQLDAILPRLRERHRVTHFANSINVTSTSSDLRIQIQTDARYQAFLGRAQRREVLGYEMPVAAVEDVLQGKIWAAMDETRRPSKRQKDLSDILRLVEVRPELAALIPEALKRMLAAS